MKKYIKIIIAVCIVGLAISITLLLYKNYSYQQSIDRNISVTGTYILNDNMDSTYLTIDYGNDQNKFYYFQSDNNIIATGSVEKDNDRYYILNDISSGNRYGKVIVSYKKVYLVDNDLNIIEFSQYGSDLIVPANNE